ncbi:MAG TPA: hypothetical protein DIC51_05790 [Coxiellaceae bacterium]|nr:hypothetical protein [Coxiellaceae bacterium]
MKFMRDTIYSTKTLSHFFYAILILHVVLWTFSPLWIRNAVSHDVIEAFVWAQQLDWGYDKNPWVIGWLTRLGIFLTHGQSEGGYYFIQQVWIALGFWSVWQLGKKFFSSATALVGVLILEGCLYYSVYVEVNNDNFAMFGFWMLGTYLFYLACERQRVRDWLLTGAVLGLALMSKYSGIFLVFSLFIFLLVNSEARKSFQKMGLYLGVIVGSLICLPHLIWLSHHDWVTVRYLMNREVVTDPGIFGQYFYYPLTFLRDTFYNVSISFMLFLFVSPFSRASHIKTQSVLNSAQFLWIVGLGPLLLATLLAIPLRWSLRSEWGVPMLGCIGLLLVYYVRPSESVRSINRFLIAVVTLMGLTVLAHYIISAHLTAGKGSADYPAKTIALSVTQLWHDRYHRPLKYVAGSRYVAGYIAFYSPDHPRVFSEWNENYSNGIDLADLKKEGAVFVEDGFYGTTVEGLPEGYAWPGHFPTSVIHRYPHLKILPMATFPYCRNKKTHDVETLLVGILPPLS